MINVIERKHEECKTIIVRTMKNNVSRNYLFVTTNINLKMPKSILTPETFDKRAERLEIRMTVRGDIIVYLYMRHPKGFYMIEEVVFDEAYVTAVEIKTDFAELRDKVTDDESLIVVDAGPIITPPADNTHKYRTKINFVDRKDAEELVDKMKCKIALYGHATLKDLCDLMDHHCDANDSKFGWFNLDPVVISHDEHCYQVIFPESKPISVPK